MTKDKEKVFPIDHIRDSRYLARRILCGIKGMNRQRFCFILGSGASMTSGIPAGGILEFEWMEELMGCRPVDGIYLDAEETKRQAEILRKENSARKLEHDFSEIAAHWKKQKSDGKTSLDSRYYFDLFLLREFVTGQDGQQMMERVVKDAFPSYGYVTLAKILAGEGGNNLVITTNFDDLVEQALSLYTDATPIIVNHEALADYIDDQNIKVPLIAKLHRGSFFGTLNTPKDTTNLKGNWENILDHIFLNYTPIVIGYGGGDKSLMSYLVEHELKNGIYWCALNRVPDDDRIQSVVRKSNGDFIIINGFDSLMVTIGELLYGDEITVQRVTDKLKQRYDVLSNRLVEAYSRVTTDTPGDDNLADFKKRVEEKDSQLKQENMLTAIDYFRRAYKLANEGSHEEAIADYTKAIKLDPKYAFAYNNRGASFGDLGKHEEAIADYTKAVEINPEYASAYYNRGISFDEQGKYEEAVSDYTKVLGLSPMDTDSYINRANSLNHLGRYEEAISDCGKALDFNADIALAYENRGNALRALGRDEEALTDYMKALQLDPSLEESQKGKAEIEAVRSASV